MSQEFINGILIGTGTTAFGFALTMVWDIWKTNKEKQSLRDNLSNLLSDELEYNALVVKKDKSTITEELQHLMNEKSIVTALDTPIADFWGIFKQNYDRKFFSNEQIRLIKDIYSKIHSIIANIESRESYRISNGAMSNFTNRMTIYDNILVSLFNEFEELHNNFKSRKK